MADVLLSIGLDSSAYSEFKKGIDSIVKQINSDPPKIKVQFDDKNIDSMRKQIEMLTKAQKEQTDAAERSSKIGNGSVKQYNSLRQVNSLLTQVTLNTNKWTAAQKGNSSDSFAELQEYASQLENLSDKLSSGEMKSKDFSREFAQIRLGVSDATGAIKIAGEATEATTRSFGMAAQNILKFVGIYKIISTGIKIFKDMASVSMEIESSMAQIQVVTGATGSELQGFFETSTSLAKELGQSITDVAKSIETFSRLGFRLEEIN